MKKIGVLICGVLLAAGCHLPSPPQPPDPNEALIAKGKEIFFNETFGGNGRTCGSCHPAENNFTIDPAFIAALPADNPLFVAEFNPALKENFENPRLMREFGLIIENLDGFDDLSQQIHPARDTPPAGPSVFSEQQQGAANRMVGRWRAG